MLNKVMIIGRLGRDPETQQLSGGVTVTNFSVATDEKWTDKSGQKQSRTEWFRCVAFGRLAEVCGGYLTKGKLVYCEGKLQTREWMDKEGGKRSTVEIVVNQMQMLSSRGESEGGADAGDGVRDEVDIPDDDDIPF